MHTVLRLLREAAPSWSTQWPARLLLLLVPGLVAANRDLLEQLVHALAELDQGEQQHTTVAFLLTVQVSSLISLIGTALPLDLSCTARSGEESEQDSGNSDDESEGEEADIEDNQAQLVLMAVARTAGPALIPVMCQVLPAPHVRVTTPGSRIHEWLNYPLYVIL